MRKKKPLIGLALSGGGVRGGAHIGVLKVLEEHGIKIDMVAGTSAGSAVAALFAYGYNSSQLADIFVKADLLDLLRLRPSRMGLITPTGYSKIISQFTDNGKIEDAKIPLFIVAANLITKKSVVFDKGDVTLAVHASSAIPGLMNPVRHDNMLLADGGILNNCPVDVLHERGADVILAVNLSCGANFEPKNTIDIIFRAMDMIVDYNPLNIKADWVLSPIDEPIGILDRRMIEKSMQLGEKAARENIDTLLGFLKNMQTDGR